MFKFLKRFFEPIFSNKKESLKMLSESTLGTIWFDLAPLFLIPLVINLLQTNQNDFLLKLSFFSILSYLLVWSIHVFIRKWDLEVKYTYRIFLEKKYRNKLILKEGINIDMIGTGKVQSIIQKGMHSWAEANWQILYQIPKTILGVCSGFYIVYKLGSLYLYLFIGTLLLSTFFYSYFRKIQFKLEEQENEIDDIKNENSIRVIMSRQEIIFSGKEKSETDNLVEIYKKGKKKVGEMAKYDFISDIFISGTGTLLPFIGVIFFLNSQNINSISSTTMVTFVYFGTRFAFTMYSTLWIVRQILEHYPQIKKFWDFIDNVPQIKNYETGKKFVHGGGEIEIRGVNFSYLEDIETEEVSGDKTKNILRDFNLKIKGGSKVALVGKSGSGKTTIAKLISGYLKIAKKESESNSGEILIDGQNLNDISLKSYYKYIGYLTQEPMVFDGSIRENLLYAVSEKVSEEQILEALKKAECLFVFQMKKGLDTQIGEKGIRLSGGERQRLAIAKLFLKNPEIIILDEPTSALDSFSEDTISKSLEELFKGRTTIIIAHRLQTVKKADRILVLENGKIVEDGSHSELMSLNGNYAKMLEMQSGF